MLGPMGAHIISALRVMTPAEIDRYTKHSRGEGKKVGALAAGGEEFDLSHSTPFSGGEAGGGRRKEEERFRPLGEAEIIPIRPLQGEDGKSRDNESKEEFSQKGDAAQKPVRDGSLTGNNELESVGIFSAARIQAERQAMDEAAKAKEDSSSVFLLKQRERLKRTNTKMAGNAALKTYFQTANVDMTQAEPDIEDPEKELAQGSKGILINKKRY